MTPPVVFAFADPARRTWLALNRAGDGYHVVTACQPGDFLVRDGLRRVGELTCSCEGGRFRGTCYVVKAAESGPWPMLPHPALADGELRAAKADREGDDMENWFDAPAGAGEEVEAFRG